MQNLVLSSLSNETRLKLLLCLSEEEKNVTQLIKRCNLSQSAISQHLEKLRASGLVITKRQGKEIIYSLKHKKTTEVCRKLLDFIKVAS